MKREDDDIDVNGKAPAFPFYPGDFERDCQMLSLEAQGLWIRMLGWMHYSPRRGYLVLPSGVPMTVSDIVARVGKQHHRVVKALGQLDRIGVFSRDEVGCIYSRRMAKDADISKKRQVAAAVRVAHAERKSDGTFAGCFDPANSPAKVHQNGILLDGLLDPLHQQKSVLSSSSSSSSSERRESPPPPFPRPEPANHPEPDPLPPPAPPAAAPAPPEFDLEGWSERLYAAHIKRRDRGLVNVACMGVLRRCREAGSDPGRKFREIERCLKAWNATPEWREKNGAFAPRLAQWIEDRGYEQWPVEEDALPDWTNGRPDYEH